MNELNSDRPLTIARLPVPTHGCALALFTALGHKPGCPQLESRPTGPCICTLHFDGDKQLWMWM